MIAIPDHQTTDANPCDCYGAEVGHGIGEESGVGAVIA